MRDGKCQPSPRRLKFALRSDRVASRSLFSVDEGIPQTFYLLPRLAELTALSSIRFCKLRNGLLHCYFVVWSLRSLTESILHVVLVTRISLIRMSGQSFILFVLKLAKNIDAQVGIKHSYKNVVFSRSSLVRSRSGMIIVLSYPYHNMSQPVCSLSFVKLKEPILHKRKTARRLTMRTLH